MGLNNHQKDLKNISDSDTEEINSSDEDISKYFSEDDEEIDEQVPNLERFTCFSEDDIEQLEIQEGMMIVYNVYIYLYISHTNFFFLCLGEQLNFRQWNASSKLWMIILQNQRIIHQQLLNIQHKHEELDKRLIDVIGKSDWYKVSKLIYNFILYKKLFTYFFILFKSMLQSIVLNICANNKYPNIKELNEGVLNGFHNGSRVNVFWQQVRSEVIIS